jgi:hypothetical protein
MSPSAGRRARSARRGSSRRSRSEYTHGSSSRGISSRDWVAALARGSSASEPPLTTRSRCGDAPIRLSGQEVAADPGAWRRGRLSPLAAPGGLRNDLGGEDGSEPETNGMPTASPSAAARRPPPAQRDLPLAPLTAGSS